MRPLSFDPQALRKHLLRHKIATLPELKSALGTSADLTVFRKLKLLDYLSSYTHRGRYYALREAARFDDVLDVETWVSRATRASVWFDAAIRRGDVILNESSVRLACVRFADGALRKIPDELLDACLEPGHDV